MLTLLALLGSEMVAAFYRPMLCVLPALSVTIVASQQSALTGGGGNALMLNTIDTATSISAACILSTL
jgi:hypothetical protein